ncbi:PilZ domain-containing protein [Kordiimonas pumila]|uniref:PilZ domain-containing protein n=1 Tax=Kordiimonas pumila TaxID=2161677 RepID=A0ABV7D9A3_9PROT|nr:PilZ domain-containing protein [Kordiimonas pumila]
MPKMHANEHSNPPSGTHDVRHYKRRSVLWPARLIVGKHIIACQIWNLSLGGARIRVDLPLKEGTALVLSVIGRGDIQARVVWVEDEATGLAFDTPADKVKVMFSDRLHILGLDAD